MEWISVKDRLPNKEGDYLVTHKYTEDWESVGIRHFYTKSPSAFVMDKSITHWMELPKPAKRGDYSGSNPCELLK